MKIVKYSILSRILMLTLLPSLFANEKQELPEWYDIKMTYDFSGEHLEAQEFRHNTCAKNAQSVQKNALLIAAYRRDFKYSDSEFEEELKNNFSIDDESNDESPRKKFEHSIAKQAHSMAYKFAPQYQKEASNHAEYDAGNAFWNWCLSNVSVNDAQKAIEEHFRWVDAADTENDEPESDSYLIH
ncbi:hypothetical protein [Pleionea sediminis]|uniref:hypothetical protein n=1 Tax=Pleionea sediminis TaxID=2569479 RepID=UPI0013DE738A|nr:hypothetical protein [Pleionea sediminis]